MSVWLRNLGPCNRAAKGQGKGIRASRALRAMAPQASRVRSDDDSGNRAEPGGQPAELAAGRWPLAAGPAHGGDRGP